MPSFFYIRTFISGINGYFCFSSTEIFTIWLLMFRLSANRLWKDGGMIKTLFFLASSIWISSMKYESLFSSDPLSFPPTSSPITCLFFGAQESLSGTLPSLNSVLGRASSVGCHSEPLDPGWAGLWSAESRGGSARFENQGEPGTNPPTTSLRTA